MKPYFDAGAFGNHIMSSLEANGWSYGDAVRNCPDLNKAMLSRACNRMPVSVTSFLVLCRAFQLDPASFLSYGKPLQNQAVTAFAQRETLSVAGAP